MDEEERGGEDQALQDPETAAQVFTCCGTKFTKQKNFNQHSKQAHTFRCRLRLDDGTECERYHVDYEKHEEHMRRHVEQRSQEIEQERDPPLPHNQQKEDIPKIREVFENDDYKDNFLKLTTFKDSTELVAKFMENYGQKKDPKQVGKFLYLLSDSMDSAREFAEGTFYVGMGQSYQQRYWEHYNDKTSEKGKYIQKLLSSGKRFYTLPIGIFEATFTHALESRIMYIFPHLKNADAGWRQAKEKFGCETDKEYNNMVYSIVVSRIIERWKMARFWIIKKRETPKTRTGMSDGSLEIAGSSSQKSNTIDSPSNTPQQKPRSQRKQPTPTTPKADAINVRNKTKPDITLDQDSKINEQVNDMSINVHQKSPGQETTFGTENVENPGSSKSNIAPKLQKQTNTPPAKPTKKQCEEKIPSGLSANADKIPIQDSKCGESANLMAINVPNSPTGAHLNKQDDVKTPENLKASPTISDAEELVLCDETKKLATREDDKTIEPDTTSNQ